MTRLVLISVAFVAQSLPWALLAGAVIASRDLQSHHD